MSELSARATDGKGARALGRYDVVGEIATGGMAVVHLAVSRAAAGFERIVAIKVCLPELRRDPDFAAAFLDEARLAAKIRHPNVVATLDVSDGDPLFLVMDYIEGGTLAQLIRAVLANEGALPLSVVVAIALDVLAGLHAAHTAIDDLTGLTLNLVHRDVSPQNILVGADGLSRLTDFGIARAQVRSSVTRTGQFKAKFGYFAPEQALRRDVTLQSDVFTMGATLWEAITGRRLFHGDSDAATAYQILHGPIPSCSSARPDAAALDAVIARALERDPGGRFESAAAFADEIRSAGIAPASRREVSGLVRALLGTQIARCRDLLRGAASVPDGPATVSPLPVPRVRSRRARRIAIGFVATVILAAGATAALTDLGGSSPERAVVEPPASPPEPPPPLSRPAPVPLGRPAAAPSPEAPPITRRPRDRPEPDSAKPPKAKDAAPAGSGEYEPDMI